MWQSVWSGSQVDAVEIMIFAVMAVCRYGCCEPGRGSRELLKMIGFVLLSVEDEGRWKMGNREAWGFLFVFAVVDGCVFSPRVSGYVFLL